MYTRVDGIRDSFGYAAVETGTVTQRWYDCWCDACTAVELSSMKGVDSNFCVLGCNNSKHKWNAVSINRMDAVGVKASRDRAQAAGRKLAEKLNVGDLVAVQSREDCEDPYWMGVAIDAGDGTPIVKVIHIDPSTVTLTLQHLPSPLNIRSRLSTFTLTLQHSTSPLSI